MSILEYSFSKQGLSHIKHQMPCQDASAVYEYGMWRVAIVADGVGSCSHADVASSIAVKAAWQCIYNCFPNNNDENDLLSLITMAFHCAANCIEMKVQKEDGNYDDYHTTLAVALYDGRNLYWGNAGDSGIIALDEYGCYHVVSTTQNDDYGGVITLASRKFQVGKASFKVAAVCCMTDGILDYVVPNRLSNYKYPVHVPRASLFVQPKVWDNTLTKDTMYSNAQSSLQLLLEDIVKDGKTDKSLDKELEGTADGNLEDDISVAVLVNTRRNLAKDIKWEPMPSLSGDAVYLKQWEHCLKFYSTNAKNEFILYIKRNNPNLTDEQVEDYAIRIWKQSGDYEVSTQDEQSTEKCDETIASEKSNAEEVNITSTQEELGYFFPSEESESGSSQQFDQKQEDQTAEDKDQLCKQQSRKANEDSSNQQPKEKLLSRTGKILTRLGEIMITTNRDYFEEKIQETQYERTTTDDSFEDDVDSKNGGI